MNADEKELLNRHLNGDLDASEQADFLSRLQTSPELRRELASLAFDETLVSELVLEKRAVARPRRRSWAPAAIAAAMLLALTLMLTLGRGASSSLRVASVEGEARIMRGGDVSIDPRPGLQLHEGDALSTERGRVVLEGKKSVVELGDHTLVSTTDRVNLIRGVLETRGDCAIESPRGLAILLNAKARFELNGEVLRVETEAGSVAVGSVVISAGQYARIGSTVQTGRLVPRAKVDESVRRACAFIESRKGDLVLPMTSEQRHGPAPRRTYSELALLALHRAGYPDSHPLKAELLGLVRGRPVDSTYAAALQAIALAEIDPAAHQDRIRYCAQLLVDSQCANGQWDYSVKTLPEIPATGRLRRRQEGPAGGDNSVSSYAVLGLLAAARAGVDLDPEVLERARGWWLKCQNPDGGWGYNDSKLPTPNEVGKEALTSDTSYGSMTASAVAALAALRELRGERGNTGVAIGSGVEWLGANFAADHTPRKAPGFLPLHWLCMAGRAGALLAVERFGSHEWYAEGADFLLKTQHPTGEWTAERGEFMAHEKTDLLDTCLAILFLKREAR